MAMQATQAKRIDPAPPDSGPVGEPASERRLAWETLRERDLEEKMGQGGPHAYTVKLAVDSTTALCDEQQRRAYIGWDIFIEWDPNDPRARVSPDLFLLEGQDPTITPSIWCTWEVEHDPPRFAMEIVSQRSRTKDYEHNPSKYSALGVEEFLIFDPEPRGQDSFALQLYRRTPRGQFLRAYAGPGPVESKVLGAWWVVVEGGTRVRLARDAAGTDLVPTANEQAMAAEAQAKAADARATAAEAQAAAADQRARSAEEQAAAFATRVRELEALLHKNKG
jgi:Uma2 family endonuclease